MFKCYFIDLSIIMISFLSYMMIEEKHIGKYTNSSNHFLGRHCFCDEKNISFNPCFKILISGVVLGVESH